MPRPSSPRSRLRLPRLPIVLAILVLMGCAGSPEGMFYVYDGASRTVLVWNDVDAVYQAAKEGKELPKADRRIESKLFNFPKLAQIEGLIRDLVKAQGRTKDQDPGQTRAAPDQGPAARNPGLNRGGPALILWKAPDAGEPCIRIPHLPEVNEIRGIALTGK